MRQQHGSLAYSRVFGGIVNPTVKEELVLPEDDQKVISLRDRHNRQRPGTMEGTGRRRKIAAFNTICSGGFNRV